MMPCARWSEPWFGWRWITQWGCANATGVVLPAAVGYGDTLNMPLLVHLPCPLAELCLAAHALFRCLQDSFNRNQDDAEEHARQCEEGAAQP